MLAAVFVFSAFWGVFDGVGSICEAACERETVAGPWLEDSSIPKAAAACAVLSAVKLPETRRLVSTGACLLLRGDGAGEAIEALL